VICQVKLIELFIYSFIDIYFLYRKMSKEAIFANAFSKLLPATL